MSSPGTPEKRRAFVASLRDLADLLESSPWLPVPFSASLQAGAAPYDAPTSAAFAAVRAVAQHLGVDVVEHPGGAHRAGRRFGPIEYFVLELPDEQRAPGSRPPRIVPITEDLPALTATGHQAVAR